MKSLLRVVLAAVAAFAATAAEASTEKRIALVVGNARYADAPLRNPANDARAMATSLRERGFEVILSLDASKQQMESAISEFGEKLSEGSTGLFFFAGHGMQVQGRNYIIPTDAKLSSEQKVKLETIDIDAVLDQMQGARSKVNVVILDACRNSPFERRFRTTSGGLAQINAPEGTLIAYSTAPGRVAADGEGANGLYTSELLKALRTPGVKLEDVFKQVRINVARASNGAQTPWEASSLVGDFYFTPPPPPVMAASSVAVPVATSSNAVELEFWNSIKGTNDPGEYRAYLNRYPKGEFAELAQMRVASLERVGQDAAKPSPPSHLQQATLPRVTTSQLDGRYSTTIRGASWTVGEIKAFLEINGSDISGYAVREGQPRPCSLYGKIDPEGKVLKSIRISCDSTQDRETRFDSLTIDMDGRFTAEGPGSEFTGETIFRSSDRRTGKVTWNRLSEASPDTQVFRRFR